MRSPPSGLKDSMLYPAFFIAPAMNPRTVCFCQPMVSIISASVAPFFRCSIATTWAVLLPSRAPALSAFAAFLALGALFAGAAFLFAFAGPLAAAPPWPSSPLSASLPVRALRRRRVSGYVPKSCWRPLWHC